MGGTLQNSLSHYLFADDLVTFHSSLEDYVIAQSLLSIYANSTGCYINKSKCCTLLPINSMITPPFQKAQQSERYLGFWLDMNGLTPQIPKIIENIISLLTKWKKLHNPILGKLS